MTSQSEITALKNQVSAMTEQVARTLNAVNAVTGSNEFRVPPPATGGATRSSDFTTKAQTLAFERSLTRDKRGLLKDEFSFIRSIQAPCSEDWSEASYERQVHDFSIKKTVSWASGSAGGYWVGPEYLPAEFYLNLCAAIIARKAGIMTLDFNSASVNIPRVSAGGTAYWLSQNSEITESSPTPNQLQMSPKWCCAPTAISKFLAQTSAGAAKKIAREELVRRIALAIDSAVFNGHGTSGQPTGLALTGSINTVAIATNGGPITPTVLYNMLYAAEYDNVPGDGLVWCLHPRTYNALRQTLVAGDSNNYLFFQSVPNSIANAAPPYILGYPLFTSTALRINGTKGSGTALAQAFLVNMKECILGSWGGIDVQGTDVGGTAWTHHNYEIRAVATVDVAVRDPNAVVLCSDITV